MNRLVFQALYTNISTVRWDIGINNSTAKRGASHEIYRHYEIVFWNDCIAVFDGIRCCTCSGYICT